MLAIFSGGLPAVVAWQRKWRFGDCTGQKMGDYVDPWIDMDCERNAP